MRAVHCVASGLGTVLHLDIHLTVGACRRQRAIGIARPGLNLGCHVEGAERLDAGRVRPVIMTGASGHLKKCQ
jgi:hypothetical protein